ncbi:hypothetical protein ACROYT_G035461 [Oculina patagonica]
MAAKLTSCFSTGLSQRHCYNMDNADNEYEIPDDEVRTKAESFSDNDNLTAKNLVFNPARNETQTRKHSIFERQISSNEEELPDESNFNWMFINRTHSTKGLVSNSSDLNQADFSMLKVGKHILQLPQLHSSSQDYRLNKNINYSLSTEQQDTRKDTAATITTQQPHSVNDESDNILSGNINI